MAYISTGFKLTNVSSISYSKALRFIAMLSRFGHSFSNFISHRLRLFI